jgi:hypothetical protein
MIESRTTRGGPQTMSDDQNGKLPARSRKAVDADAKAAREKEPSVGVAQLRDLQKAMEDDDQG